MLPSDICKGSSKGTQIKKAKQVGCEYEIFRAMTKERDHTKTGIVETRLIQMKTINVEVRMRKSGQER